MIFDLVAFLTGEKVIVFLLVFMRLSGLFIFFPFFTSTTIAPTMKAAIAFYFTIIFYPLAKDLTFQISVEQVIVACLIELSFGFCVGLLLRFSFWAFEYAAEQISFVMGFSQATVFDPQSGTASNIVSQFLFWFCIMVFLSFDGHHLILQFMYQSIQSLDLGSFSFITNNYAYAIISAMAKLFVLGFMVAFPILGVNFLVDIIFAMIMKTMPSFNLLVVGFPVKIAMVFVIIIATLGALAYVFKREFFANFNLLKTLLQ